MMGWIVKDIKIENVFVLNFPGKLLTSFPRKSKHFTEERLATKLTQIRKNWEERYSRIYYESLLESK